MGNKKQTQSKQEIKPWKSVLVAYDMSNGFTYIGRLSDFCLAQGLIFRAPITLEDCAIIPTEDVISDVSECYNNSAYSFYDIESKESSNMPVNPAQAVSFHQITRIDPKSGVEKVVGGRR